MKLPLRLLSLWALAVLYAAFDTMQAQPATLAIRGASVVDVTDGSVRPDQTVLVDGERVVAVGPAHEVVVPNDAEVVDAPGSYLIPGLWDMHARAARAGRAPRFWPLFVAHGVTDVREMGSFADSLLYWRAESERMGVLAPRISWASPMLDGEPPVYSHAIPVLNAEAATAVVDSLQRLGFEFLKVYNRLSRKAYFAVAERARQRGTPSWATCRSR